MLQSRIDRARSNRGDDILFAGNQPSEQTRPVVRLGSLDEPAGVSALTPRELRVLTLVAVGQTNAAIAVQLSCSPRTVAKHLEHVYLKLHVANRAAAAARFATERAENRRKPG